CVSAESSKTHDPGQVPPRFFGKDFFLRVVAIVLKPPNKSRPFECPDFKPTRPPQTIPGPHSDERRSQQLHALDGRFLEDDAYMHEHGAQVFLSLPALPERRSNDRASNER